MDEREMGGGKRYRWRWRAKLGMVLESEVASQSRDAGLIVRM